MMTIIGFATGFLTGLLWHWYILAKTLDDCREEFGRTPYDE